MKTNSPYKEVGLNSKTISSGKLKRVPVPKLGWKPKRMMHRFFDFNRYKRNGSQGDESLASCDYCGQPKFVVENKRCVGKKLRTKEKL